MYNANDDDSPPGEHGEEGLHVEIRLEGLTSIYQDLGYISPSTAALPSPVDQTIILCSGMQLASNISSRGWHPHIFSIASSVVHVSVELDSMTYPPISRLPPIARAAASQNYKLSKWSILHPLSGLIVSCRCARCSTQDGSQRYGSLYSPSRSWS